MKDFIFDASRTFLYFTLSPLQWIFWKFPKVYEALISTIIFWKNTIPSKNETLHTLYHWYFLIVSALIFSNLSIIRYVINATNRLNVINNNILNKIKDLR